MVEQKDPTPDEKPVEDKYHARNSTVAVLFPS